MNEKSVATLLPGATKSGWLLKQGRLKLTWPPVFVLLTRSDLLWYKARDSLDPLGSVAVKLIDGDIASNVSQAKPHAFEVPYENKSHVFAADTAEDLGKWTEAIRFTKALHIDPDGRPSVERAEAEAMVPKSKPGADALNASLKGPRYHKSSSKAGAHTTPSEPETIACPSCGDTGPWSQFCHSCGTRLPLAQVAYCKSCGKAMITDPHLCSSTGEIKFLPPRTPTPSRLRASSKIKPGDKLEPVSESGTSTSEQMSKDKRRSRSRANSGKARPRKPQSTSSSDFMPDYNRPNIGAPVPAAPTSSGFASSTSEGPSLHSSTDTSDFELAKLSAKSSDVAGPSSSTARSSGRSSASGSGSGRPHRPSNVEAGQGWKTTSVGFALTNDESEWANSSRDQAMSRKARSEPLVAGERPSRSMTSISSLLGGIASWFGAGGNPAAPAGEDAGVRYYCCEARTDCPRCGERVVLNGPVSSAQCPACLRTVKVPRLVWVTLLESMEGDLKDLGEDQGRNLQVVLGETGSEFRLMYGRQAPRCSSCSRPLKAAMDFPSGSEACLVCNHCSSGNPTIPVPSWLSAGYPAFRQTLCVQARDPNEGPLPTPQDPKLADAWQDLNKSIAITCTNCQTANYTSRRTARSFHCTKCRNDIFIPDEVWRLYHPSPRTSRWYLRAEGALTVVAAPKPSSPPPALPPPPSTPGQTPGQTPGVTPAQSSEDPPTSSDF